MDVESWWSRTRPAPLSSEPWPGEPSHGSQHSNPPQSGNPQPPCNPANLRCSPQPATLSVGTHRTPHTTNTHNPGGVSFPTSNRLCDKKALPARRCLHLASASTCICLCVISPFCNDETTSPFLHFACITGASPSVRGIESQDRQD